MKNIKYKIMEIRLNHCKKNAHIPRMGKLNIRIKHSYNIIAIKQEQILSQQ